MRWKLKDKNGKFRSRRGFKQDCRQTSEETWEKGNKHNLIKILMKKLSY